MISKPDARTRAALYLLGKLSERETDVFKRIAQGETTQEICEALNLTHSTVSTYRRRVLTKLHQQTNADLTMIAHRLGIVEAPDLNETVNES